MAANSIREQIIAGVVTEISDLSTIKTIERVQPNDLSELTNYAQTQLPLCVIIGGVPQPDPHFVGKASGANDVFISDLKLDLYVYFIAREDADTELSSLLDDLWVLLQNNQRRDGLALSTTITPNMEVASWDPYLAFMISAIVRYKHTIGGI